MRTHRKGRHYFTALSLVGLAILAHESALMHWPVNHPYQVDDMQYLDHYASPVPFYLEQSSDPRQMWIETISWKPRAYIIHNFLSDEECDHLIRVSNTSIKRSTVGYHDAENNIRTSSGTFLRRLEVCLCSLAPFCARLAIL